ncbi:hypothetical protein LSH36_583g02081 [Paralvinella palmiformis]|uniref:proline--tRNA ligase n=1 Tax=Paralvinella palmiformis TaxID=53620 RepID=A0AAD9J554_9ANNE|nr:hypothetical protein LSH36_583g02081 [Paralvinella palmiformis]
MADFITPKEKSYTDWYIDIILKAKLADYSPVRGCMVIRPQGYALWERIQSILDAMFKETGHENAYFPLLIPESFIQKEAEHVEGFAPELAIVTHGGGEKLEEAFVIRPTSETIIWSMYKQWIHSYRDLPLLINQWANVIRWEKRTRLFLRTSEFLWQEGHTAHENKKEAKKEAKTIFSIYHTFAKNYLALFSYRGEKTEAEKFAGADITYSMEVLMKDGKALQAGTSHFLGQKFAKAFNVQFQTKTGNLSYVWATSWGVSSRLIGAIIMAHSDNKGLIIPPKLAPIEIVIVPIGKQNVKQMIMKHAHQLFKKLSKKFRVKLDTEDQKSPGWRFSEWELKGVPLRIELGPRDIEQHSVTLAVRDTGEKHHVTLEELPVTINKMLNDMQERLYQEHKKFSLEHTFYPNTYDAFKQIFNNEKLGCAIAPWNGSPKVEKMIKEQTKASIRIILSQKDYPLQGKKCLFSGQSAKHMVLFAKAY